MIRNSTAEDFEEISNIIEEISNIINDAAIAYIRSIAIIFAVALASLSGLAQDTNRPSSNGASDATVEQLKRATQELLDAVAPGDVAVWRGEKVFERDDKGRIVRMLDRRENNDLVWKKVK
jgi:hypothetical protein